MAKVLIACPVVRLSRRRSLRLLTSHRHPVLTLSFMLGLTVLALSGCSTIRDTQPPRTGTEQLMLSRAARDSISQLELDPLAGMNVYLDTAYLERIDRSFLIGELRSALAENGARLVRNRDDASVIVEARSGVVGINKVDRLLGIPALPLPIPTVGTVETPELALIRNRMQKGLAEFAVIAYRQDDRSLLLASDPALGRSLINDWSVLGLVVIRERTNIPDDIR